MANPYKKKLQEFVGTDTRVCIHRKDAPKVSGTIDSVDDDGCTIKRPCSDNPEAANFLFIAHRDIRGVVSQDWDYSIIDN